MHHKRLHLVPAIIILLVVVTPFACAGESTTTTVTSVPASTTTTVKPTTTTNLKAAVEAFVENVTTMRTTIEDLVDKWGTELPQNIDYPTMRKAAVALEETIRLIPIPSGVPEARDVANELGAAAHALWLGLKTSEEFRENPVAAGGEAAIAASGRYHDEVVGRLHVVDQTIQYLQDRMAVTQ